MPEPRPATCLLHPTKCTMSTLWEKMNRAQDTTCAHCVHSIEPVIECVTGPEKQRRALSVIHVMIQSTTVDDMPRAAIARTAITGTDMIYRPAKYIRAQ